MGNSVTITLHIRITPSHLAEGAARHILLRAARHGRVADRVRHSPASERVLY